MTSTGRPRRSGRVRGALAGLIPTLAIALLFVVGGTTATPSEVAMSLALVALITMAAGWLAGPVARAQPPRFLTAALAYAIALIAMTGALSMVQAAGDTVAGQGFDPIAITGAIASRGAYAVASAFYLIIPAIVLGLGWSVGMWGLTRLVGPRSS